MVKMASILLIALMTSYNTSKMKNNGIVGAWKLMSTSYFDDRGFHSSELSNDSPCIIFYDDGTGIIIDLIAVQDSITWHLSDNILTIDSKNGFLFDKIESKFIVRINGADEMVMIHKCNKFLIKDYYYRCSECWDY